VSFQKKFPGTGIGTIRGEPAENAGSPDSSLFAGGKDRFFVLVDLRQEIKPGGNGLLLAEVIINSSEREHLQLFQKRHFASVVKVFLHLFQTAGRFQERFQQSFLHVARTDDPGNDAVDRGIEIIESDMHPLRTVVNDLTGNRLQFIITENVGYTAKYTAY